VAAAASADREDPFERIRPGLAANIEPRRRELPDFTHGRVQDRLAAAAVLSALALCDDGLDLKRVRNRKNEAVTLMAAKAPKSSTIDERASMVRKGAAQFVRLPRELHFPADIEKVSIRRHGGGLFSSPVRPSWSSFFAIQVDVPDDFLERRDDSPPQSRDP
jgi:antitoxin VapB